MMNLFRQSLRASLALAITFLTCCSNESLWATTATFTNTPAVVSNTYTGVITLQIGGLNAGDTVVVQKYLDLNSNGVIDSGDFLAQQFQLTDGVGPPVIATITNINVPGDLNPASGAITAQLTPIGEGSAQLAVGQFLFKLSSPSNSFTPVTNLFVVTNFPFAQSVSGTVVSNGTSTVVPNALVFLSPSGKDFNPVAAAVANASGSYMIKAQPGNYKLVALKGTNFVSVLGNAPTFTLNSGANLTTNVSLLAATATISGRFTDATNANLGLPGILMAAQASNGSVAGFGGSDTNGNFTLPVNSTAQWGISAESQGFDFHGYVQFNNKTNVNGGTTNVIVAFPKVTALIYGTVKDSLNNPMIGVRMEGDNGNNGGGLYQGDGTTLQNGNYVVGVVAGNWGVGVDQGGSGPAFADYDFTQGPSWSYNNGGSGSNITAGTVAQANFSAISATNFITGYLKDGNNVALPGIGVNANATINGTNYNVGSVDTDSNGFYSLPVANGNWNVNVNCCNSCDDGLNSSTYQCPNGQNATINNDNAGVNFIAAFVGLNILSGNIYDQSSDPIPGLTVEASGDGTNLSTVTDTNGYFQFDVANGDWTLSLDCAQVMALGYECPGTYDIPISGSDSTGNDVFLQATPLQILSPLPNGTVGVPYSEMLQINGGVPPYSWSLVSGALPGGLNLRTNGLISGTPTNTGTSTFTVNVSDSASDSATEEFDLVINSGGSNSSPDISYYFVSKGRLYSQTGPATVVANPATPFSAICGIEQATIGTVLAADMIAPGGSQNTFPGPNTAQELEVTNTYTTQLALDSVFTPGQYEFVVDGLNGGYQFFPLSFPAITNYPPTPQINNFTAAQSIIASNAFTLQWLPDTFGSGDFLWFFVLSANGSTAFSTPNSPYLPGALTASSTSAMIPASTLKAGTNYQGYLVFIRSVGTTGIATANYFTSTAFSMSTMSTGGVVHPQISLVSYSQAGGLTLSLTGTPSQSYAIQASTNLTTWTNLIITNLPSSTVQFTDHQASTLSRRFYRAELQ